jgi:hypothetical protein
MCCCSVCFVLRVCFVVAERLLQCSVAGCWHLSCVLAAASKQLVSCACTGSVLQKCMPCEFTTTVGGLTAGHVLTGRELCSNYRCMFLCLF